ncbi:MAG: ABC transporter permease [Bacillaceae bacterium]
MMYNKALWKHHLKNTKVPLILLYIINFFYVGQVYLRHQELSTRPSFDQDFSFGSTEVIGVIVFFTFGLGCLLVGTERTNGQYEALLSMPFSRRQLFLSKWTFGLIHLVSLTIINQFLFTIILKSFEHSKMIPLSFLLKSGIYNILLIITLFTVVFATGALTGNFIGQVALSFFFIFLPFIGYFCINSITSVHNLVNTWSDRVIDFFLFNGGYSFYNFYTDSQLYKQDLGSPTLTNWSSLIGYLIVFFLIGYIFTQSSRHEYNQMFVVFPKIRPILVWCFTIVVAIFSAELMSNIMWSENRIVPYYIALIVFGGLAYYFGNRMVQTKYRFIR